MTSKREILYNLAHEAGFKISELHLAFHEDDNEFIRLGQLITEKCAIIAARTPVSMLQADSALWREACIEASKQIRKEMGL